MYRKTFYAPWPVALTFVAVWPLVTFLLTGPPLRRTANTLREPRVSRG